MANRLVKRGVTTYTPAVPSRAYQPAYCVELPKVPEPQVQIRVPPSGHRDGWTKRSAYGSDTVPWRRPLGTGQDAIIDEQGRIIAIQPSYGPGATATTTAAGTTYTGGGTKCYPAVPAVKGSPAKIHSTPILGWNAGARSIAVHTGDCYASFVIAAHPVGVVCGLAPDDASTAFNEATHAFYAHGSTLEVVESGTVVAVVPGVDLTAHPTLVIRREQGQVTYQVGNWRYVSTKQSTGPVLLDAALYATNDAIDSPVFDELSAAPPASQVGQFTWVLPAPTGVLSENAYGQFAWVLPTARMAATAVQSGFNRFEWTLPPLDLIGAEVPYARAELALPPLGGSFEGGFPQFSTAGFDWMLPPLVPALVGLTGAVGRFDWTLPALSGWAADRPYAAMRGTLDARLEFYADTGPAPGGYGVMEPVMLVDYQLPDGAFYAALYDGLELGDNLSLTLLVHGDIYDGLQLKDTTSVAELLFAVANSGLVINSNVVRGAREGVQYATNVETGALTRYEGFDFHGFAQTADATYGWKSDGLYRIEPGADAGALRDALLDLGVSNWDVTQKKHIPAVFLGLGTDGEAYVRMRADDGSNKVYRVIQRRDVGRANPHRGLTAREWHIQLQLVGATEGILDNIEFVVELSTRRWTR